MSHPCSRASAARYSSLRTLLPPYASPELQSSRFAQISTFPPRCSLRRSRRWTGDGPNVQLDAREVGERRHAPDAIASASAARVGAGRRGAFLRRGQLCCLERRAVEHVALADRRSRRARTAARICASTTSPATITGARAGSRPADAARARASGSDASRSSVASTDSRVRRWPCVAPAYAAERRSTRGRRDRARRRRSHRRISSCGNERTHVGRAGGELLARSAGRRARNRSVSRTQPSLGARPRRRRRPARRRRARSSRRRCRRRSVRGDERASDAQDPGS